MDFPLPLIEFAVFIGLVFYLFTMSSSPLRRGETKPDDGASMGDVAEGAAPADVSETREPKA